VKTKIYNYALLIIHMQVASE